MMIDWPSILNRVVPIVAILAFFGAPALILWIIRSTRLQTRQLELSHDKRIADLQRERDVLDAKLTAVEPELEFLRGLVRSEGVRARIATLPHLPPSGAPPPSEDGEELPAEPLHARSQTR